MDSRRTVLLARLTFLAFAGTAAWAATIAAAGGFTIRVGGLPLASRSPVRAAVASLCLAVVYAVVYRRVAPSDLFPALRRPARYAWLIAAAVAITTTLVGARYGTLVAAGADAFGYVSQADLWLGGDLRVATPLAASLPWPDATWSLSPLGYRPSAEANAIVPTYAPGLPLLMAVFKIALGRWGPFLVGPVLAGVSVWLTFLLGMRLWSPLVGLAASALLAASPAFVFQLMWPMSDIPAAAALLTAVILAVVAAPSRPAAAGAALALFIMVRPNLLPAAALVASWYLGDLSQPLRSRLRHTALLTAGALPGVLVVMAVQWYCYGAPWRSGYGALDSLYSVANLGPNLARYPRWLWETQTPLIFACLVPLVVPTAQRLGHRIHLFLGLMVAGVWLAYLFYTPFEEWWYLRFLLPALPYMLLLAVVAIVSLSRWLPPGTRAVLMLGVVFALGGSQLGRVQRDRILNLHADEARYVTAARFVDQTLPSNAVIIALQHAGSVRYYGNRLSVRFDYLPANELGTVIETFVREGYRPFVLLEHWEEAQFKARFAADPALDRTMSRIVAVLPRPIPIRVYDPLAMADVQPEEIPAPPLEWCPAPAPGGGVHSGSGTVLRPPSSD